MTNLSRLSVICILVALCTANGNKQVRLRLFRDLTHIFTPVTFDKNSPDQATVVSCRNARNAR